MFTKFISRSWRSTCSRCYVGNLVLLALVSRRVTCLLRQFHCLKYAKKGVASAGVGKSLVWRRAPVEKKCDEFSPSAFPLSQKILRRISTSVNASKESSNNHLFVCCSMFCIRIFTFFNRF